MQNLERYHFSFIPCHLLRAPSRLRAISVISVPDLALADSARTQNSKWPPKHKVRWVIFYSSFIHILSGCEGSLWWWRSFGKIRVGIKNFSNPSKGYFLKCLFLPYWIVQVLLTWNLWLGCSANANSKFLWSIYQDDGVLYLINKSVHSLLSSY